MDESLTEMETRPWILHLTHTYRKAEQVIIFVTCQDRAISFICCWASVCCGVWVIALLSKSVKAPVRERVVLDCMNVLSVIFLHSAACRPPSSEMQFPVFG